MDEHKITFSSDGGNITLEDLTETGRMSEGYFQTHSDPGQLQVCEDTGKWIIKNMKYLNIIKSDGGVIGYAFALPSNREMMTAFVSGKINESELFQKVKGMDSKFYENPEGIYLCASVVKKEFRGKGLAANGFVELIGGIVRNGSKPELFYWGYSKEGGALCRKVSEMTGLNLKKRV